MMMVISRKPVVLETMRGLGLRDVRNGKKRTGILRLSNEDFLRSPRIPHHGSAAQPQRHGHL